MTERVLVLRFDYEVTCAIVASDLVAIESDGPSARISVEGSVLDLTDYLPQCSSSAPAMRLIVGGRRAFRVRARIELVETQALYRVPRVLRECGCATWLRGFVLLDDPNADGGTEHNRPALWIDLVALAKQCDGLPMNQKEMQR